MIKPARRAQARSHSLSLSLSSCSSFFAVSLLLNDDNANGRSVVRSLGRSCVRASVKAVASSAFHHRLLAGCVRARQPAWLPRWCRRCLWNRSVKIINGPLASRRNSPPGKKKRERNTNNRYGIQTILSYPTQRWPNGERASFRVFRAPCD